MVLIFERSGGFTAIPLRLRVNTEDLDIQESTLLHSQVEVADFFNLPERGTSSGGGYDRFVFKLTVQKAGKSHAIEYGDASIPETLQPLIDQLSTMARLKRRPD
jgi:hypothetical protein